MFAFITFSVFLKSIENSLSFNSRIIFSAIFLPTHFTLSIVLLSSHFIAIISLSTQRDNICIATFQPIQEIFISSANTFFSSFSINQKRFSLFSVL